MPRAEGFLLIDKAVGSSSFDVIRQLRRITGIRKIGHTGTLDPLATGLLICAVGRYTRLCRFLELRDKTYTACLELGSSTDTGDREGRILKQSDKCPQTIATQDLTDYILNLKELPTPAYSAVKVGGKPAYALARSGQQVDLANRQVRITKFEVLDYTPPRLMYRCRVSKGTYIRSLSEEIARWLDTPGHTAQLCRTSIGELQLQDAVKVERLAPDNYPDHLIDDLLVLSEFERATLSEEQFKVMQSGQAVINAGEDNSQIVLISGNRVAGMARRQDNTLYPVVNL